MNNLGAVSSQENEARILKEENRFFVEIILTYILR
jgi:hypothetical protein